MGIESTMELEANIYKPEEAKETRDINYSTFSSSISLLSEMFSCCDERTTFLSSLSSSSRSVEKCMSEETV